MLRKILLSNVRSQHTWVKPEGYDTGINVFNCLAKEKVPLVVKDKNFVSWYTCGPTVYDSAHIGHASCYVKLDLIQRILRDYFKINLVTVMNITDVDDKIIKKSVQLNKTCNEIARYYEKEFWEDMESLHIVKPNLILRVTENMSIIEDFVKKLLEDKSAYADKDSSIIFNIKTVDNYGKLQNIIQKKQDEEKNTQITNVNFTVWKAAKENEPYWDTTFGGGRPGWHTECSALASAVFGSSIDIHAGGIDLRFPHHENEEAQCCAYFSKSQWVNYWFHTGHLLQNAIKMSKSLNNTLSIRAMLKMCDPDTFRMMCLMSHYRHNMGFSEEYVGTAQTLLKNYKNFITDCNAFISGKLSSTINKDILNRHLIESVHKINVALRNDFDTATCVKVLNSIVATVNKMLHAPSTSVNYNLSDAASVISVLNFVVNSLHLFGLDLSKQVVFNQVENGDVTELLDILNQFRQNVRMIGLANKDKSLLQLCDIVRNDLKKCGITVKDHGKLSSWSK